MPKENKMSRQGKNKPKNVTLQNSFQNKGLNNQEDPMQEEQNLTLKYVREKIVKKYLDEKIKGEINNGKKD